MKSNGNKTEHCALLKLTLCTLSIAIAVVFSAGVAVAKADKKSFSDPEITDAVDEELFFDDAVLSNPIDVETIDGIVTLEGAVGNILAKQRAAILAETVSGVRSVINRIEVKPASPPTGQDLAVNVSTALLADPAADSYEVNATANDSGEVTLTGTVDSWQEKQLTENVAKGVFGVTKVSNNIKVNFLADRPDSEIQPEIEQRLDWNAYVDDALVNVEVDDGKVSLTGTVGSAAEKRQVVYDAWVAGVTEVDDSELYVERWARDEDLRTEKYVSREDPAIEDAVTDAFLYDPRVLSFNIEPTVTNGWVSLRGNVSDAKAKQAAEQVARRTVGVIGVTNRLKVRPEESLTDTEIETNIVTRLAVNPWVRAYEIDVSVVLGTAFLKGTVHSWFEKTQAETAAIGAKGVTGVKNFLEVEDENSSLIYDPYLWYHDPIPWYYHSDTTGEDTSSTGLTDTTVADNIEGELLWSPFVDGDEVEVTVADGTATLTGTVDSKKEKDAASENAYEGGANKVLNLLKVNADS